MALNLIIMFVDQIVMNQLGVRLEKPYPKKFERDLSTE